jgi:K+-sensing histidine kinase KdpD
MNALRAVFQVMGKPLAGLLLCVTAALAISAFSAPREWRLFVPLAFVIVIMLLAARYGLFVSVFGSITAALIFAYFLYAPLGSFRVESQAERSNLGWMMLSSIALSYLLLPSARRKSR